MNYIKEITTFSFGRQTGFLIYLERPSATEIVDAACVAAYCDGEQRPTVIAFRMAGEKDPFGGTHSKAWRVLPDRGLRFLQHHWREGVPFPEPRLWSADQQGDSWKLLSKLDLAGITAEWPCSMADVFKTDQFGYLSEIVYPVDQFRSQILRIAHYSPGPTS